MFRLTVLNLKPKYKEQILNNATAKSYYNCLMKPYTVLNNYIRQWNTKEEHDSTDYTEVMTI